MLERGKRGIGVGAWFLTLLLPLSLACGPAAEPIVGTWNYSTSNHWTKGPVPPGNPGKGEVVIAQDGGQLKMEFKSGMVFSPPELKYFEGRKEGEDYVFSNSAKVDSEGGVASNSCTLKMAGHNHLLGKSSSEYRQGSISFHWGFDIELRR